jgi:hypothetical protein
MINLVPYRYGRSGLRKPCGKQEVSREASRNTFEDEVLIRAGVLPPPSAARSRCFPLPTLTDLAFRRSFCLQIEAESQG